MSSILLISPETWDGHFVSKHHYAWELARRGHQVLFYGPPESSGGIWLAPVADAGGRLGVLRAPRVAPGLRFLPGRVRRFLEARWLRRVEQIAGQSIDVVWNFENSRFFDMRFAGDRLKIYHQVDLNQDFHVAAALASSDLRLTNSGAMLRRFSALGFDGHKIDHGVAHVPSEDVVVRDPRLRPNRLAAAYVGNLDIAYLDVPLLADLIAAFPQVDFHLIGTASPGNRLRSLTADAENVFWWGRIDSAAIVPTLRSMDVLLLAYDTEHHREQLANPHKLMEYMASGVVTVATFTEEYTDKRHLLAMADRREDYPGLFASVIGALPDWNAPERRDQRIAFARDNTYERQIERISALLGAASSVLARNGNIRL